MKLIYIAGKYKSDTEWGLVENIRQAEKAALKLWREGWAVICPHKNTAHFGGSLRGYNTEREWLDGDFEILRRCDAIYMLANWQDSEGARMEHDLAVKLGLEILYEEYQ